MSYLTSFAAEGSVNASSLNRRHPQETPLVPRDVFSEEWWLEAASGGAWEQVEVGDRCGAHAILPFMRERRYGAVRLSMPPYTRTLGPIFSLPPCKPVTRLDSMRSLAADLLDRLPRFDLIL